jgi:esterase/lipase superfamily enzyme
MNAMKKQSFWQKHRLPRRRATRNDVLFSYHVIVRRYHLSVIAMNAMKKQSFWQKHRLPRRRAPRNDVLLNYIATANAHKRAYTNKKKTEKYRIHCCHDVN